MAQTDNKTHVEASLATLQDANRLGMHCWEDSVGQGKVPSLLGLLEEQVTESEIAGNLETYPRISLSLLPSVESGVSIWPYDWVQPAYLFDLSQERENPGRVLRVFPQSLDTEWDHHEKHLKLEEQSGFPKIDELYKGKSEAQIVTKSTLSAFTEAQLDALAECYEAKDRDAPPSVCSEAVAVVGKEHIKAISIPIYERYGHDNSGAMERLSGALAGLAHLERDIDLPVVLYHINGPQKGRCEYVAQGRQELIDTALAAMEVIGPHQQEAGQLWRFKAPVEKMLGLDINRPLREQNVEEALRRSAEESHGRG